MTFKPISALPEIRGLLDAAPGKIKADISHIKHLLLDPNALLDPDATLPADFVALTIEDAKGALNLLALHARQLSQWKKEDLKGADRAEVSRLLALVPEIRPLIQRLVRLASALERRAKTGSAGPLKKWRH